MLLFGVAALGSCVWIVYSLKSGLGPHTIPDGPVSDAQPLIEFREFPAYWLGMEYDGVPLTAIGIRQRNGTPPYTEVYLGYGYCRTHGGFDGSSCNPPILILEQPPCTIKSYLFTPPSDSAPGYVWTRDVGVYVQTTGRPRQPILDHLKLTNESYFAVVPVLDTATAEKTILSDCAKAAVPTVISPPLLQP